MSVPVVRQNVMRMPVVLIWRVLIAVPVMMDLKDQESVVKVNQTYLKDN